MIKLSITFTKKTELMQRGILMFAAGHGNYGKMAAALASTIKVMEAIPIALLYHGNALNYLSDKEKALFDKLIELPAEHVYNKNGTFNPVKARLSFYDLTPFKETLCIDVDNAWLNKKKPTEVFNDLSGTSFTIQNAGHTLCDEKADQTFSVWADLQSVIKGYKIAGRRFYRTYGEWIYFKKDQTGKKIFHTARKIFSSKPKGIVLGFIGQTLPDELAFSIAMAQTEIYPHKENYHPTTYYHINSKAKMRYFNVWQLTDLYYAVSMGGSMNPEFTIKNYNILTSAAYHKLGLQKPFQWIQKRSFLEERKNS